MLSTLAWVTSNTIIGIGNNIEEYNVRRQRVVPFSTRLSLEYQWDIRGKGTQESGKYAARVKQSGLMIYMYTCPVIASGSQSCNSGC